MELIDSSTGTIGRDETATHVYRHGDETVRVQVKRNSYDFQSFATAAVLNAERNWTVIAEDPASNWHADRTPLVDVVRSLACRAGQILG